MSTTPKHRKPGPASLTASPIRLIELRGGIIMAAGYRSTRRNPSALTDTRMAHMLTTQGVNDYLAGRVTRTGERAA